MQTQQVQQANKQRNKPPRKQNKTDKPASQPTRKREKKARKQTKQTSKQNRQANKQNKQTNKTNKTGQQKLERLDCVAGVLPMEQPSEPHPPRCDESCFLSPPLSLRRTKTSSASAPVFSVESRPECWIGNMRCGDRNGLVGARSCSVDASRTKSTFAHETLGTTEHKQDRETD